MQRLDLRFRRSGCTLLYRTVALALQDQELTSLQVRVEELESTLTFALAQLDDVAAMQASLEELERHIERYESVKKPRPKSKRSRIRRPLAFVVLSGLSLLSGVGTLARRIFLQTQTSPAKGAVAPRKQPQSTVNLTLITQGETWLEAQSSTGKVLHYGLLKSGRYQIPFQQPVRLRAGRPDLVIVGYGRNSKKLGAINDIGWHEFSPLVSR